MSLLLKYVLGVWAMALVLALVWTFVCNHGAMRVYIVCDEWWPVYSPEESWDEGDKPIVTVDKATYDRWCDAFAAFAAAQNELSLLWEKAAKR